MLSPTIYKRTKQYMRQDVLRAFPLYACDEYFMKDCTSLNAHKYSSKLMLANMQDPGAVLIYVMTSNSRKSLSLKDSDYVEKC